MALVYRKPKGRNQHTLVADGVKDVALGIHVHPEFSGEGVGMTISGLDGKKYDFCLVLEWHEIEFILEKRIVMLAGKPEEGYGGFRVGVLWGMLVAWFTALLEPAAKSRAWTRVAFTRRKNPPDGAITLDELMDANQYGWRTDRWYHGY